jgi:hypothetical protein
MGVAPSAVPSITDVRPYSDDLYMPIGGIRMNDERGSVGLVGPSSLCRVIHRQGIIRTGFAGIWSIVIPSTTSPCPRTGHFCCYDAEAHFAYIGYGLTDNSTPLCDLWRLNTLTHTWTNIPLHGQVLSARSGTRAALIGTHLVLFGGYSAPTYFTDLHTIDVKTGEVGLVSTKGSPPSPRSTPVVVIYNNKYYVWGGFNGGYPSELNVLSFETMTWFQYPQQISGRTAVPAELAGNILYIYGGSKTGGLICVNLDTFEVQSRDTIGSGPPSSVMGAGMIRIGRYLFFFGGRSNNDWGFMYVCDLIRMWWFIFHIIPDGETVFVGDGSVSNVGLFMLPRLHSFSMCYVRKTRQIMAFLGYPEKNPPPLFIVSCGEALSIINMKEDMIDALKG